MEKLFEKYCENYGFMEDVDFSMLKHIFDNQMYGEINIELTKDDEEILSRTIAKNVTLQLKDNNIVITGYKNSKKNIANFPLEEIDKCIIDQYNGNYTDIMLSIHNLIYKISLFI